MVHPFPLQNLADRHLLLVPNCEISIFSRPGAPHTRSCSCDCTVHPSDPSVSRRNHLPSRPPPLQSIHPRSRFLRPAPRLTSKLPQTCCHPFLRSHKTFEQTRNIEIGVDLWEMNSKAGRAQFNVLEF